MLSSHQTNVHTKKNKVSVPGTEKSHSQPTLPTMVCLQLILCTRASDLWCGQTLLTSCQYG